MEKDTAGCCALSRKCIVIGGVYDKADVNISPETVLDGSLTLLVLGENQKLKKYFRL